MPSVLKELRRGIVYSSSAHKVWATFKEGFDKINETKIYHMNKEIGDLLQGTTNMSTYFSHVTDLWDEFELIIPIPGCDCPRYILYMEYLGLQKTMKFLMGLNDTYSLQRSQILMMDPTSSLNQFYSMIIHKERQCLNGSSRDLSSGSTEGLITANASR